MSTLLRWHERADDIGAGKMVRFDAPSDALTALATAVGVDRIVRCHAELQLAPVGDDIAVEGRVQAQVVQTCGITLEPFEAAIDEPVALRFADDPIIAPLPLGDADEEGSAGMADAPEPIVDGMLDLGRIVEEFLALGVDPYPRKPGVKFETAADDAVPPSPFAALAKLRDRGEAKD